MTTVALYIMYLPRQTLQTGYHNDQYSMWYTRLKRECYGCGRFYSNIRTANRYWCSPMCTRWNYIIIIHHNANNFVRRKDHQHHGGSPLIAFGNCGAVSIFSSHHEKSPTTLVTEISTNVIHIKSKHIQDLHTLMWLTPIQYQEVRQWTFSVHRTTFPEHTRATYQHSNSKCTIRASGDYT